MSEAKCSLLSLAFRSSLSGALRMRSHFSIRRQLLVQQQLEATQNVRGWYLVPFYVLKIHILHFQSITKWYKIGIKSGSYILVAWSRLPLPERMGFMQPRPTRILPLIRTGIPSGGNTTLMMSLISLYFMIRSLVVVELDERDSVISSFHRQR